MAENKDPDSIFNQLERASFGRVSADEYRKQAKQYVVIFAIASTVLAIAVWSIWKQLG